MTMTRKIMTTVITEECMGLFEPNYEGSGLRLNA